MGDIELLLARGWATDEISNEIINQIVRLEERPHGLRADVWEYLPGVREAVNALVRAGYVRRISTVEVKPGELHPSIKIPDTVIAGLKFQAIMDKAADNSSRNGQPRPLEVTSIEATVKGKAAHTRLAELRNLEPAARRPVYQAMLLGGLYDNGKAKFFHKRGGYTGPNWCRFAGSPLTAEEIGSTLEYLKALGLIRSEQEQIGFWKTHTARFHRLSREGIRCIEKFGGKVSDWQEAQEAATPQGVHINTITAGQVNFARVVSNIDSSIAAVASVGNTDLGQALAGLKQALLEEPSLDDTKRSELLDNLDDLAEAAKVPAAERRRGRIAAAINAIGQAAETATKLGAAWLKWKGVFQDL